MIKFFGLLSKKEKVKIKSLVSIYCQTLDEVINHGFVEIKDFIKRVPSLLLAFEKIQEQARTLKGTLARLKSESEALSSAQAFGFFGSEAFLNKQIKLL